MTVAHCPRCSAPLSELHQVADLEQAVNHPDPRTRRFAETALERGETGAWLVLHCTSCRCDCRRYVRSI